MPSEMEKRYPDWWKNDTDEGEDKIAKKARLDQLEPMEVVAHYTRSYHKDMAMLNTLSPSIEPTATGS